ncbi:MAG: prephenate dehydratase [Candidatus Altiarchaeales archaeon ex4484_2]|nr:MAG: prephenate dehydratase [Candidatus Altiarchaeales archaeon ex4484_2]
MRKIRELREEIDGIDQQMLELLDRRGRLASLIGEIKRERELTAFSPERESEIFSRIEGVESSLSREGLKAIYREIISACRRLQEPIEVSYLGPEGSFTHQAANQRFGSQADYKPIESIEDVFSEIDKGRCDYGVVPIESSLEGMVTRTLDMFIESSNKINGEIFLPVSHCLLSRVDMDSIRVIYSHPQAIAQCRSWIRRNLPGAEIREASSTSEAARIAVNEKNSAAIASSMAAAIYKLGIVEENIQDRGESYTRFLIISKNTVGKTGRDKTSIMFSIKDRVGALYEILKPLAAEGISLTRIESRPSRKGLWDYYFFVDFEGHEDDSRIKKTLEEVKENCVFLNVLGSYPRGEQA